MDQYQKTIKKKLVLEGIALHSGALVKIALIPSEENTGIIFLRTDLKKNSIIKACWENIAPASLCTKISNKHGASVSTIEHLMFSFYALGITNLLIEINGPEIPIMDGSSKMFIDEILNKSKNNIIIVGGVTSLYFYNKRIEDRALHWDNLFVDKKSKKHNPQVVEQAFIDIIDELSKNNEVILLYPIPEMGRNLQKKKFENMVRVFNYKYSDFLKQNKEVIEFFDSINKPRVHKVYSYKAFCNKESMPLCSTHDKNNFFFYDGYHPSLIGAKMINDLIIKKINYLNK